MPSRSHSTLDSAGRAADQARIQALDDLDPEALFEQVGIDTLTQIDAYQRATDIAHLIFDPVRTASAEPAQEQPAAEEQPAEKTDPATASDNLTPDGLASFTIAQNLMRNTASYDDETERLIAADSVVQAIQKQLMSERRGEVYRARRTVIVLSMIAFRGSITDT